MKKNLIISAVYLACGLAFGVFFREFTKWNDFSAFTVLGVGHAHLLVLGTLLFLVLTFGLRENPILKSWKYKTFLWVYDIGLAGTATMMLVRGVLEVKAATLTNGQNLMVSGIAGLFHIALATGLVFLFLSLFQMMKEEKDAENAKAK